MPGLGAGRALSTGLRRRFERAFDWDFSGVRLHAGPAAGDVSRRLGARAFAEGRNIVFGKQVADPEATDHRHLLAHELTHVVQQDMGAGVHASPALLSLSPAAPASAQAAPLVTNVVTSAAELGVGGRDITATATVGGRGTRLTWSVSPGGAAPAGVSVVGSGRTVRIHAAQPGGGAVVGGTPVVVRAAVAGPAGAGDFFDSAPIGLVQVVNTTYAATPPLAPVPSLIPGVPPANSAEPNRDGIAGNTALVNAVTAPAGRPVTVALRRPLGAAVAGNVVTPGNRTGDIGLRISDTATGARLDETQPSAAGPAARMANLTVNAVPTRVSALAGAGALPPYGVINAITFAPSDAQHPPLTRIVGELITNGGDDFNIAPPNGAFNPAFQLALAVPANSWNDQLATSSAVLNVADGRQAIDVNRFVGPGVPQLPRRLIYRQSFQYASWQGAGAVVSNTIASGQHIRSLIGGPGAFRFRTEHRFGGVAAPAHNEPYVGNPLIVFNSVAATPTAAGATGLAADGVATANLSVNCTVAGRTVNWSVLGGSITITGGNPATLPATAQLQAGNVSGNFRVRASDSIFPNRRVDGSVRVVPVRLRNLRAAPQRVPAGTLISNVSVNAEPGARTLNWAVDATAASAGVTVSPVVTGPGLAMNATVTRPAGFSGRVTVTATDAVLAARRETVRILFL
ncbi:eCIS core domain-containing protein [Paraburkholderia sp. GAS42]|uniref:eCIS core domain-containing protein n=1 Tax=Paraburkholderia sp. GAS42 TaxID=3035135 RepID=UPI003D2365E5